MTYKDKYAQFYNSAEWKAARNQKFVEADGLCERCRAKGKLVQGIDVHHIIPIDQDWSKRLEHDNLILLCKDCHNEMHNRISPLQEFEKVWEEMK